MTGISSDTIRAAFCYGPRDVRVEEIPAPQIEHTNEVLVRVQYAGICGTELHLIEGQQLSRSVAFPKTPLGHEYAGVVVAVGSMVQTARVGQRVTMLPRGPCGICQLCRNHQQALCRSIVPRGGAWADLVVVPQSLVYVLPDEVSTMVGALTEPLSCAVRMVDRAELCCGEQVAVLGGGPIGLLTAILAKQAGATTVIISEPRASRRELARQMGVDVVIDPTQEPFDETVWRLTNGRGVDCCFEAVGLTSTMLAATQVVAVGGTVIWGGLAPVGVTVPINQNDMFVREYTLRTSWGGVVEYTRSIRLEQAIDLRPAISGIYTLDRLDEALHDAMHTAAGKVMLRIDPAAI